MVHIHTMDYSVIKKGSFDTCYIMDEPWKYDAIYERSQTQKVTILYDSIFYKMSNTSKSIETKSILIISQSWGRAELGVTVNRCGFSLGWWKCSGIHGDVYTTQY